MKKYVLVFGVAALILGLDQLTKWYIRATVQLYESIPIIDSLFHITYVRNKGGAFSLFAGVSDALRVPFFLGVSVVAIITLVYMIRRIEPRQSLVLFALGCILGGAIGNLIDRALVGQVTDFLDFHWRGWYWPAFNVADSGISVGMVILILHSLLARDPPGRQQRVSSA
jgi:signal peptidase II